MNLEEVLIGSRIRIDLLWNLDDLEISEDTEHGLPVYTYRDPDRNLEIYPIEISSYDIDNLESNLISAVMDQDNHLVTDIVSIPLDEDIARYWNGKLVYPIDYSHEFRIDYIYIVESVNLEFDEDSYEIEDYEVYLTPFLSNYKKFKASDEHGKEAVNKVLKKFANRD